MNTLTSKGLYMAEQSTGIYTPVSKNLRVALRALVGSTIFGNELPFLWRKRPSWSNLGCSVETKSRSRCLYDSNSGGSELFTKGVRTFSSRTRTRCQQPIHVKLNWGPEGNRTDNMFCEFSTLFRPCNCYTARCMYTERSVYCQDICHSYDILAYLNSTNRSYAAMNVKAQKTC